MSEEDGEVGCVMGKMWLCEEIEIIDARGRFGHFVTEKDISELCNDRGSTCSMSARKRATQS